LPGLSRREIDEGDLVRYRCHVGHAYTVELMSLALAENLTRALGSPLRALDERIALADRLSRQASASNRPHLAQDELAGRLAQEPNSRTQPDIRPLARSDRRRV
jgi:hypothetical protein